MVLPQNSARPRYSMATHGQGSTDNFGNMILRTGAGNMRRPSWDKTETVVRFLPRLCSDRTTWEPFRLSTAPRDFGDWIRSYPAVRSFGENGGVTMLLYNPVATPSYDLHQNPCVMLFDAINQAIRTKQEKPGWASLNNGGVGKPKPLSRYTDVYIARAAIFRLKNEDKATSEKAPLGLTGNEPAMYLEMSDSCGRALIDLVEERNEEYQYPSDGEVDMNAAYKCGDLVALEHGAFVHFHQEGYDPREQEVQSGPRQIVVGSNRGGGKQMEPAKRFACFADKEWKGFQPNMDSAELEDIIRKKDRPWDDDVLGSGTGILNFMTSAQQAQVLQDRDAFPADAFLFAWRDHPDWINQRTKDRAVGRVASGPEAAPVTRTPVLPQKSQPSPMTTKAKAGGWGNKAWEETAESVPGNKNEATADVTAPTPTDYSDSAPTNTEPVESDYEKVALQAMERARQSAQRPNIPSRPQL